MVKPSVINAVLHTRFGVVHLARLAVLVALAGPLLRLLLKGDRPPQWWAPAAVVTAAAILITPGLAGHAGTGMLIALAIPFDMIHLAGAAVWVGGLAMLVTAALAPRHGDDTSLRPVVSRYSQWALGAVVAIAVTGGFSAWRQVGSWSAVTTTTFGRLVLAKTIIFAALVILASRSRRIVHGDWGLPLGLARVLKAPVAAPPSGDLSPSLSPGPGAAATTGKDRRPPPGRPRARRRPTQPWRVRLRAAVLGEVVLAAGIVAVSATLVNAQPARTSLALPYAAEVHAGAGVLVDVIVDPTRAGPVSIHLYTLSPAGAQIDVPEVDATFSLASAGINDLKIPLQKAGPGHYLAYNFDIPLRGTWKLQMTVRTTDIDEFNADQVTVHIH
jgi:copper transport protein